MQRLPFAFILAAVFSLLGLVSIVVLVVTHAEINSLSNTTSRIKDLRIPSSEASARLISGLSHASSNLRGWILFKDDTYKSQRLKVWVDEIDPAVEDMTQLSGSWQSVANVERLKVIKSELQKLRRFQAEVEQFAEIQPLDDSVKLFGELVVPVGIVIAGKLDEMSEDQQRLLAIEFDTHQDRIESLSRNTISLFIFSSIFLVLLALYLVRVVCRPISKAVEVTRRIGEEALDFPIALHGSKEMMKLGHSLEIMQQQIKERTERLEQQNWLKNQINIAANILQGATNAVAVGDNLMPVLATAVNARQGVIYTLEDADGGEPRLKLLSSYALYNARHAVTSFAIGEGLVGQCARQSTAIHITQLPTDYLKIGSGLGDSAALNVILLPVLYEGRLMGVVELASFVSFTENQQSYLEQVTNNIGFALHDIQLVEKTQTLLKEKSIQARQLAMRSRELEAANQHLATTAEDVQLAMAELASQKFALDQHAIVVVADIRGAVTFCNDKFLNISGYSREEVIGKNHKVVHSNVHDADFFADIFKTVADGQVWNGDIAHQAKNGEIYWVDATIVPFMEGGVPVSYISIQSDITDRKGVECALIEAKEVAEAAVVAKSDFLAAMSHEIRTPMAGIIGMAELLGKSTLLPNQLDWLTSIKTSSTSLMAILNEILDQSKLRAGKMKIVRSEFALRPMINDVVHLFLPKITEKGLTLDVSFADSLAEEIYADPARVGQILSNLLSNALKFTAKGSVHISVSTEPRPLLGQHDDSYDRQNSDQLDSAAASSSVEAPRQNEAPLNNNEVPRNEVLLRIAVTDTGIGLDVDAQKRLFGEFTQVDNSISRTFGGTGLGLSISMQLTELMGGQIGLDSAKGVGSCFWYTVPCQVVYKTLQQRANTDSMQQPVLDWQSRRALKVLVAEDTIVIQYLMEAELEDLGHQVTLAENGQECVKCLEDGDFDLILMDVRMPTMDGMEATRIIRGMRGPKANIPIIAVTADISAGNITEYFECGMNDVCMKPIEWPVLLRSINKLLAEEVHYQPRPGQVLRLANTNGSTGFDQRSSE